MRDELVMSKVGKEVMVRTTTPHSSIPKTRKKIPTNEQDLANAEDVTRREMEGGTGAGKNSDGEASGKEKTGRKSTETTEEGEGKEDEKDEL